MNQPNPLPSPDHMEISIGVIAVGLVTVTVGLLICMSMVGVLAGVILVGFGGLTVWSQYLATFRRDAWGALVISIQCSLITLFLLANLILWIMVRYWISGMKTVLNMATPMMMLGAVVGICLWVTVANWQWYWKLRKATQAGLIAPAWRHLSVSDLLALMVMIGVIFGMLNFVFKTMW
ncbi:hypothetical protein [Blastopirellula marina]|uniref:Uncharacterized protein n=1 Tax=Blastopirellula marina TaxID=124 RepID=A0A2S8GLC2_9BACT|nr:hypothetical protein [Blastopirellula marina]PQO45229.1 hypothetical protein C5Y93_14800 [Blastopirellula marina]